MEFNITKFFSEACPRDYSASAAELGGDAGRITWRHAVEDSAEYLFLDSEDKREAFKEFVRGFGAWTEDEIDAWTDAELNALMIQWISGDIREAGLDNGGTWEEYMEQAEQGIVAGRLFKGDDGQIYWDCSQ